jgi:hypothetical protein
MSFLTVLYCENEIIEVNMPQGGAVTVGSGREDTVRIPRQGLTAAHLTLTPMETGVHVSSLAPVKMRNSSATNLVVAVGDVARVAERVSLTVVEKRQILRETVRLAGQSAVTVGRSGKSDICLSGAQVSSNHAVFRKQGANWMIEDQGSRNGTYVNGKLIRSAALKDGDVVFIAGWKLVFQGGNLRFENAPDAASFSSKLSGAARPGGSSVPDAPYPFFQRSPRIRPQAGTAEVEILSPPSTGTKPAISWLSVLLPPVLMATVMIAVATAGGNLSSLS